MMMQMMEQALLAVSLLLRKGMRSVLVSFSG